MFYTERLIKNVASDIITVVIVCGFLNIYIKDEPLLFYNISIRRAVGFGVSAYIFCKYL